jgi:hypothetical protein
VAANQDTRRTLNLRKCKRLAAVGADLIVSSFLHFSELLKLLCVD